MTTHSNMCAYGGHSFSNHHRLYHNSFFHYAVLYRQKEKEFILLTVSHRGHLTSHALGQSTMAIGSCGWGCFLLGGQDAEGEDMTKNQSNLQSLAFLEPPKMLPTWCLTHVSVGFFLIKIITMVIHLTFDQIGVQESWWWMLTIKLFYPNSLSLHLPPPLAVFINQQMNNRVEWMPVILHGLRIHLECR